MCKIFVGKDFEIYTSKLNRHGFITGSTGSGKTITLKVIAEQLAKNGVPVFLSDIKGDIASLIEKGEVNEKIAERISQIGLEDFEPRRFDVELFDIFGEKGIPLRTTISQMGPILLSRLLGLNEVQEGILNIAFKLADDENLLLIDIKDLRAMLNFVNDNKDELSKTYGNISSSSVGAILRSLLVIEQQGGDIFFGEPDFDVKDFLRTNSNGEAIINILSATKLIEYPKLYTSFMLWLLSEIYENLPEAGDLDKPKMVFFFDEAHLLFEDNNVLVAQIEKIVRLIRSKAVGVFFVTQKATDLPDEVLSQLGNRIQHSLRAYTPKEQKDVKAIAESFRQEDNLNLVEEILNLKTGEAIVSILDEDSKPTFAKKVMICPPESKIGTVDDSKVLSVINNSNLYNKYFDGVDSQSAFEILSSKKEQEILEENERRELEIKRKEEERLQKEREKIEVKEQKEAAKAQSKKSNRMSPFERFTNNIIGSIGRSIGNQISRGIFGNKK